MNETQEADKDRQFSYISGICSKKIREKLMQLNRTEKRTFFILMLAAFFNGFIISTFNLQDIIAKKALHAYDWQITILVMLWPLSNLFSIWWGKILEHSKSLSKFFILTGFIGRLSLILMLWVHNFYQYLAIFIILFSFNALISPAQNSIYQLNISPKNRGLIFGYVSSLITLVAIFFSFAAGKILDINENWFRYIFLAVGIMGCLSSFLMALIKIKKENFTEKAFLTLKQVFIKPVLRTVEVLKNNKDFAIFQRNFFIYGIAFMILLPAIPKYLVEYLQMDYSHTFLAKGIISQIGILFLAPLAGKVHDRKNPAFFTTIVFGILSLYPLTLLISSFMLGTSYVYYVVYFAFFIFSVGLSGMIIAWNISSIFFAGKEDVSMYQSVHVTLTGVRGIFAPFLGLLIMKTLGIRAVFIVAIFLFLFASFLSFKLYLKMCKKEVVFAIPAKQILYHFRKIFPFS